VYAQPHRRHLGPDNRRSELAESPFGILRLHSLIDEQQYQAGLHWRRLVGRMKWAIACPPDANVHLGSRHARRPFYHGEPCICDKPWNEMING